MSQAAFPYQMWCNVCVFADSAETLEEGDEMAVNHLRRCIAPKSAVYITRGLEVVNRHEMTRHDPQAADKWFAELHNAS